MKTRRKNWKAATILAAALAAAPSCESETELGKCVGVLQGDRRDPQLAYDLSVWNAFWGVVGFELILPPIMWLHHETYCPTGRLPSGSAPAGTNPLGETRAR